MANNNSRRPAATTAANTSVVEFVAGIKSVQVYGNGDNGVRYRVTFDQQFDAIRKEQESGEYVDAKVDYIDFVPSVLMAQCINQVEGLDLMYTKKKETALRNDNQAGFGAAELQVVLRNAKLTIKRTKFAAGDEYQDKSGETQTHENAGYNTDIVNIKVSDRVRDKLDDMMDSVFDI